MKTLKCLRYSYTIPGECYSHRLLIHLFFVLTSGYTVVFVTVVTDRLLPPRVTGRLSHKSQVRGRELPIHSSWDGVKDTGFEEGTTDVEDGTLSVSHFETFI